MYTIPDFQTVQQLQAEKLHNAAQERLGNQVAQAGRTSLRAAVLHRVGGAMIAVGVRLSGAAPRTMVDSGQIVREARV